MYLTKPLSRLFTIATAAGLLASQQAQATLYDFSYTFLSDGTTVNGQFDATLAGGFYTNMTNVSWTTDPNGANPPGAANVSLGSTSDIYTNTGGWASGSPNDYAGSESGAGSGTTSTPASATDFFVFDAGTSGGSQSGSYFYFSQSRASAQAYLGPGTLPNDAQDGVSDRRTVGRFLISEANGVPSGGSSVLMMGCALLGIGGYRRILRKS